MPFVVNRGYDLDYRLLIRVVTNLIQVFEAKFLQFGYSYKFEIDVKGTTVFFEPDEERNFRAIVDPSIENGHNKIDVELIQLIAESLQAILK